MTLVTALLILFAAAIPAAWASRLPRPLAAFLLALPAATSCGLLAYAGREVLQGGEVIWDFLWIPSLGLDLVLRLDGLSLLMGLLITGVGAFIMAYAVGYAGKEPQAGRLYAFLYLFMGAMAGVVLSDHLITLFVFWELTSISSYLLIGYYHDQRTSRWNALQALLVTGLGGVAMLAGFILLADVVGTWRISEILLLAGDLPSHPYYGWILALVLLGAFTKSAQFPFHFWLPNAMAAPTPVSAYLHSATMVKAGVFLLARLHPALGGTVAWETALVAAGSITLILGGVTGLRQTDLKRILAYTTLAVLGLLTLLLGVGTDKAILAALVFLVGHALYKATLFMVAGAVDHATGTREIALLRGLRTVMPWTAGAAALAALSKMGFPPFFGFLGKEYVYKAGEAAGPLAGFVLPVLVTGNVLIFCLAFRAAVGPFWKRGHAETPHHPHEVDWMMRAGPVFLATLGLIAGLFPEALLTPFIAPAVTAVFGETVKVYLALWHGINLALLLSIVTVTAGAILVWMAPRAQVLADRAAKLLPGAEWAYERIFDGTVAGAKWQTRMLQSGYLRNYFLIILAATLGLVFFKLSRFGGWIPQEGLHGVTLNVLIMSILMVVATVYAVVAEGRLSVLVALGVIGFGMAYLFAVFGAPDLAITQILVETLTVVLFALVIFRLPALKRLGGVRTRVFDAVVGIVTGLSLSILLLKSLRLDIAPQISKQLAEWSYPEAYGSNVVNVILVDFRALDTTGEIAVLAIAGLGVWMLLAALRPKPKGDAP